jgi:hypothetical protein
MEYNTQYKQQKYTYVHQLKNFVNSGKVRRIASLTFVYIRVNSKF